MPPKATLFLQRVLTTCCNDKTNKIGWGIFSYIGKNGTILFEKYFYSIKDLSRTMQRNANPMKMGNVNIDFRNRVI